MRIHVDASRVSIPLFREHALSAGSRAKDRLWSYTKGEPTKIFTVFLMLPEGDNNRSLALDPRTQFRKVHEVRSLLSYLEHDTRRGNFNELRKEQGLRSDSNLVEGRNTALKVSSFQRLLLYLHRC